MSDKPNIVLFMSDQHNPNVLGCYGNDIVRTPNIDKLAQDGVAFHNCYCASPLCVPSRTAFLTGQYPSDTGVWTNNCILNSEIPTFVHKLGASGYETILCGRMHFTGPDQRHGFEKRLIGDVTEQYLGGIPIGLPESISKTSGQNRSAVEISGPGNTLIHEFDNKVTEAAIRCIQTRSNSRPLLLIVGSYAPHCPYICPKSLYEEYMDKIPMPDNNDDDFYRKLHPAMKLWRKNRGIENLSPATIQSAQAAYYGLVTYMDSLFGTITKAIHETKYANNSVVLYTSDHGDMLGQNGLWWKSNFYDGSVKVPLIVSWPGHFKKNIKLNSIASLVDIAPTLTEIAQTDRLHSFKGKSLLPLLENGSVSDWENIAFSEYYGRLSEPLSRMIRKEKYKLISFAGFDHPMLFNLEKDPNEREDLACDPLYGSIRRELIELLMKNTNDTEVYDLLKTKETYWSTMKKWAKETKPDQSEHFV